MGLRIVQRECPDCHNALVRQDLSNGAIVLVGSRKFRTENGTLLLWCKTCQRYVTLDGWNPLGG